MKYKIPIKNKNFEKKGAIRLSAGCLVADVKIEIFVRQGNLKFKEVLQKCNEIVQSDDFS
jgi:hypothetical protein